MTTTNTPSTGPNEGVEKPVKMEHKVSPSDLMREAIKREFGTPINPQKFNDIKKNKDTLDDLIRNHMKDIRAEDRTKWYEISDELIQNDISKEDIIEEINHLAKNLIFKRKRAFDRACDLYATQMHHDHPNNWKDLLRKKLLNLNENELQNLITRKVAMKKALVPIFPTIEGYITPTKLKLDTIFHDRETQFDEEGQLRMNKILSNYEKFNQVPNWEDISFILDGYKGDNDNNRKREFLIALGVVLTFRQAHEIGLIDNNFLHEFAKNEWEELYADLPDEKRRSFVRGLSYNDTYTISARDFTLSALSHVFSDEHKRNKLSREIQRSASIDLVEKPFGGNETLSEIRREKMEEAEKRARDDETGETGDTDDYDIHDAFIDKMAKTLRSSGREIISNIEGLKQTGNILEFKDAAGRTQFLKLLRYQDEKGYPLETETGDAYGIELEGTAVVDGKLRKPEVFRVSYDAFARFLQDQKDGKVITGDEFNALIATNDQDTENGKKYIDARGLEDEPVTKENIGAKLDILDPEGSEHGFEEGTTFVFSAQDDKGVTSPDEIWRVHQIHGDMVDLMDSGGFTRARDIPLRDIYATLSSGEGFKRIGKITTDADLIKGLAAYGVSSDAVLEDGKLIQKLKDDHGHEEKKEITCFKSEKGGHIRLEFMKDGMVRFGEYTEKVEASELKKHAEKKGYDKVVKSHYNWMNMSYPAFLAYLEKNKFNASSEDLIVPNATHGLHGEHHHPPHAHMTSSFINRILQFQNPASIWKGFEMIYHGIEHTLEKGAKLDAARFAMGTAKFLHLPDGVSAQIYSDIVSGSKEIIEKYEQKIFGLPGPRGRFKCIHIAHNKDSRPEEIVSAMNYMLKSYGHLYAEDIKHYQSKVTKYNIGAADPGYFAFLDGFILTAKLPGGLLHWRKKAYEKAITEMGTLQDHEGEPTEEQLIHALFKNIDGNWEEYPYAASVVKASGGPSGFEKNWKMEGFENAYKKGKDQTQMVNAQGRLNKAVGYFNTHEIYKAVGAMEMVVGKVKDPEYQAMPFIWAVGGYSKHASHTALQKIKTYAEQGYSFHAFSFLRNEEGNNTYREVVRIALKDLIKKGKIKNAGALSEFNAICERLENGPESTEVTDKKYKKVAPATAMMKFWQEHAGSGLHDMLQGHNGWLVQQSKNGDKAVTKYMEIFENSHKMQLNDGKVPTNELGKDWNDEHGLKTSRIWELDNNTGLRSLKRTLAMINIGRRTGDFVMQKEVHDKLWSGILEQVDATRDIEFFGDPKTHLAEAKSLQKEQFLAYRNEIIDHYRGQLGVSTGGNIDMDKMLSGPYEYWDEIRQLGIDPRSIFDPSLREANEEIEYQNWINGRAAGKISSGGRGIPRISQQVQGNYNMVVNSADSKKPVKKAGTNTPPRRTDDDSDGIGMDGIPDLGDH